MNFLEFGVHGGGDGAGGWLIVLDQLLEKFSGAGGQASSFELFPGIAALSGNLHPMIVHFPIALLSCFFLLDIGGLLMKSGKLRYAARCLLYLGAFGALAAATAGWFTARSVPHGAAVHEIMEWHGRLGIAVAVLSAALALWRWLKEERLSPMAQTFQVILSAILVTLLSFGADLGGLMVYGHGVAVAGMEALDDHHHQAGLD